MEMSRRGWSAANTIASATARGWYTGGIGAGRTPVHEAAES